MIVCSSYYIFALMQNSVRFLYIEVFYVNVFRKLVVIFFCVYLLVVIFSPHIFYVSDAEGHSSEIIQFNNAYLIFAAAILSYALFDSGLVITYICSIYFRITNLRNFLSKYWFVRLIVMIVVDMLLVCYYLHCLVVHSFNFIFLTYLLLVLAKAAILTWYLKREVGVPSALHAFFTLSFAGVRADELAGEAPGRPEGAGLAEGEAGGEDHGHEGRGEGGGVGSSLNQPAYTR